MKGVRRSYQLFQAFRNERTDPATFYRLLADDTVTDVSRYCQLVGATVLDVGGASGYVADAFREVGSHSVTAEYDFDQMVEHDRRLVNGVAADGSALPIATSAVDVSYSSNVLEHVLWPERMLCGDGAGGLAGGRRLFDVHQLAVPLGRPRDVALALPGW